MIGRFLKTRIILTIIFIAAYYLLWKIGGFELAVIVALGQMLGETYFKNDYE